MLHCPRVFWDHLLRWIIWWERRSKMIKRNNHVYFLPNGLKPLASSGSASDHALFIGCAIRDFTTDFTSCGSQNIATRFCRVRCVNGSVKLLCKLAQKWGAISCKVCWAETMCICSCRYRQSWPCSTSCSASKAARQDGSRYGVPWVAQALLGKTLLGQNLFLNHLWKCHWRYHHAVFGITFL